MNRILLAASIVLFLPFLAEGESLAFGASSKENLPPNGPAFPHLPPGFCSRVCGRRISGKPPKFPKDDSDSDSNEKGISGGRTLI